MERSEGDMSLKNPVTPPGIDPGTFRLVSQRLNHYATRICTIVPFIIYNITPTENIINSFITLCDFKPRAKRFSLMMVNVTAKHVGEML